MRSKSNSGKKRKTISIALMGAGVRLRLVVNNLLKEADGRVHVKAVYDPDPLSVQNLRKEFGNDVHACESEETLVSHPGVDWVFIGSLNCHHSRQAVLALDAGKNVFCEKPLATNLKDCLAVRDAVVRNKRTFAFGLVLRYSPQYQKVRQLVASGRIGKIVSFEFNETLGFNHGGYIFGNWRRNQRFAGTHLLEKCCHDLDLANWIVGSLPVRAASFGGRNFFIPGNARHMKRIGADCRGQLAYRGWPDPHGVNPFSPGADIVDNQVAILEYAHGIRATFHTNCNAAIPERRLCLCGTEGLIRSDACTGMVEARRIGHDTPIERFDTGHAGGHAGGDEVMARGLIGTLLDGRPPLATVEDGIRSAVVVFGIDQAMEHGKVVDLLPLWKTSRINPF